MRLPCHLRRIRARRPIRDLAEEAGVHRGTLSQIENGRLIPRDDQFEGIERAYGAGYDQWYPRRVFAAIAVGHDKDEAA